MKKKVRLRPLEGISSPTVLSVSHRFSSLGVSHAALEEAVRELLNRIAAALSVEGIIPGHIKAAVQTETGLLTLSVTRADTVDDHPGANWEPSACSQNYTVTVNVLSVLPCSLTQAALEEMMETHLSSVP